MRFIRIAFSVALLAHRASFAAAETRVVAVVWTSCGSLRYVTTETYSDTELRELRVVLSMMYNRGALKFSYAGGPEPSLNESTQKMLLSDAHYKTELRKLKGRALEKRLVEIQALAPENHRHEGPSPGQLSEVLGDKAFMQRAGSEMRQLIAERLNGKPSRLNGEKFDAILAKKFGLSQYSNDWHVNEDCRNTQSMGDYFGPEK